jgi:hypothetical protein
MIFCLPVLDLYNESNGRCRFVVKYRNDGRRRRSRRAQAHRRQALSQIQECSANCHSANSSGQLIVARRHGLWASPSLPLPPQSPPELLQPPPPPLIVIVVEFCDPSTFTVVLLLFSNIHQHDASLLRCCTTATSAGSLVSSTSAFGDLSVLSVAIAVAVVSSFCAIGLAVVAVAVVAIAAVVSSSSSSGKVRAHFLAGRTLFGTLRQARIRSSLLAPSLLLRQCARLSPPPVARRAPRPPRPCRQQLAALGVRQRHHAAIAIGRRKQQIATVARPRHVVNRRVVQSRAARRAAPAAASRRSPLRRAPPQQTACDTASRTPMAAALARCRSERRAAPSERGARAHNDWRVIRKRQVRHWIARCRRLEHLDAERRRAAVGSHRRRRRLRPRRRRRSSFARSRRNARWHEQQRRVGRESRAVERTRCCRARREQRRRFFSPSVGSAERLAPLLRCRRRVGERRVERLAVPVVQLADERKRQRLDLRLGDGLPVGGSLAAATARLRVVEQQRTISRLCGDEARRRIPRDALHVVLVVARGEQLAASGELPDHRLVIDATGSNAVARRRPREIVNTLGGAKNGLNRP